MENKRWYRQLLLSHFAILFISGTVIVSIVFALTYSSLRKETVEANHAYTDQVVEGMTSALKNIEVMLANQIVKNEAINSYLSGNANEPRLINYKASGEIPKLGNNQLIHSIYFYRYRDQMVLTNGYISKLEDFPDKSFIEELHKKKTDAYWSPVRMYTEFPLINPPERVISITKSSAGNQGVIVLNVKADLLLSMASRFKNSKQSYMVITDNEEQLLYSTKQAAPTDKPLTSLTSDYIGWHFTSGTNGGSLLGQAALLSLTPLSVILLVAIIIIAFILHITRRSYRPIENIVRLTSSYQGEQRPAGRDDEFSIIEGAIDSMLNRIGQMDQHQAENLLVKRKQFFIELQENDNATPIEGWRTYIELFGLSESPGSLFIAIMEIDRYVPLLQRDRQQLIASKKRLNEAVEGLADFGAEAACPDWISNDRLALLLQVRAHESSAGAELVEAVLDRLRQWAEAELAFTVTIGIGSEARDLSRLRISYRDALAALQYKMTAGNNRIIIYEQIKDKENAVHSFYFKALEDMVHHFRIQSLQWRSDFARIFDHLEERLFRNEDMQLLLKYLMQRFAREMEEISPEINEYWQRTTYVQMTGALKELETMSEIRQLYDSLIGDLYDNYAALLESGSRPLIYEVRTYIEENYANPDLSLNHISEQFGINGKYASQLFKEAFDVRFVDFLIGLRLRQAQKFLRETDISINEISRQVGYEHPISFGRIFKKMVGTSPGDYRKMTQPGKLQQGS